ncbi:MAG: Holliday junction resolvase RuvX [Gammaproteobacteria bacterium]|nr:Holliday junction resolvase RuvX [Gammaproteobacteria bacterium]
MTPEAMTVLAFDFGEKHIGIAVGQTLTGSASALAPAGGGRRPQWSTIDKAVKEWQPALLVVGHPLNMDGTEQRLTAMCARFGRQLKERYALTVETAEELLTTIAARERIAQRTTRGGRAASVHSVAAEIIFETWFHNRALGTD